jgi:hypothetical protein
MYTPPRSYTTYSRLKKSRSLEAITAFLISLIKKA